VIASQLECVPKLKSTRIDEDTNPFIPFDAGTPMIVALVACHKPYPDLPASCFHIGGSACIFCLNWCGSAKCAKWAALQTSGCMHTCKLLILQTCHAPDLHYNSTLTFPLSLSLSLTHTHTHTHTHTQATHTHAGHTNVCTVMTHFQTHSHLCLHHAIHAAIYDDALEVLFDTEFVGGGTLNGRVTGVRV